MISPILTRVKKMQELESRPMTAVGIIIGFIFLVMLIAGMTVAWLCV